MDMSTNKGETLNPTASTIHYRAFSVEFRLAALKRLVQRLAALQMTQLIVLLIGYTNI